MNSKHRSYVQKNWHLCNFCLDEYFQTEQELRDHTSDFHSEIMRKNDEKTPEILQLEEDDVLVEVMPTNKSKKSPKSAKKAQTLLEKVKTTETCIITCPHCNTYETAKWSVLEQHIQEKHPDKVGVTRST